MTKPRHSVATINEHLSGKPRVESVIGECPQDGREWENQCARCGSSVDSDRCENCEDGYLLGGEYDEDFPMCDVCNGKPVQHRCISSPEFCNANPLPGREGVARGKIEWFTFTPKEKA